MPWLPENFFGNSMATIDRRNSFVNSPAQGIEQTQSQMVDDLIHKAFRGSAKKLLIRVLSSKRVQPQELAEMQKPIQEARRSGKGTGDTK
jgi:predicted transcriptional regulator